MLRVLLSPPLLLALLLTLDPAGAGQDPARAARSRDPLERLEAVRLLREGDREDAEKLLLKLSDDGDWEVACEAAAALAEVGSPRSVPELVKLACGGPVRRLRLAAARAAAILDAEDALARIEKRLKGDETRAAAEALAVVASALPEDRTEDEPPRKLQRLLEDDSLAVRAAAARALVALSRESRSSTLEELARGGGTAAFSAALEQAALDPRPSQRAALEQLSRGPDLPDVLERRATGALAATLRGEESAAEVVSALCAADGPTVAQRGVRLAAALRDLGSPVPLAATAGARAHADAGVRALAAAELSRESGKEALEAALELGRDDSARVREAAHGAALTLEPVTGEAGRALALEALSRAETPGERLRLVVALGAPEAGEDPAVVRALTQHLVDRDWRVAAASAVSLGRTRSREGTAALASLAAGSEDWRLRGAAVVGLTKRLDPACLPALAGSVDDPEPSVARTAHAYLTSLALGDRPEATAAAWRAWISENGARVRLDDPKERRARRERYGYGAAPGEIYRGLDVVVLESRGDRMQDVLARLEIEHRLTASSQVASHGLDAGGVFVSNCTGELEASDIERLDWFVTVGGYLCGSCWALTETVGRVAPGHLSRLPTRDEVMDQVEAGPCAGESPYLEGVFGEAVVPIYNLEGAHLLRVDRPETVEVLVDSPACAERWGGGTLAAWFRHGHGTVLVSANHFRNQGLEHVVGLSKPEERRAHALDHMGTDFEFLRRTEGEKFWTSTPRAAQEVLDLSVFRLVTNFVRLRRLEGL